MNLRLITRVIVAQKPQPRLSFHTLQPLYNSKGPYEDVEEPKKRRKRAPKTDSDRTEPKNTDPTLAEGRKQRSVPTTALHEEPQSTGPPGGEPPRRAVAPDMTPRKLLAKLNQFIVGQDRSKKVFAVAIYNHYLRSGLLIDERQWSDYMKRMNAAKGKISDRWENTDEPQSTDYINVLKEEYDEEAESVVIPDKANLLVVGPSGSGKTMMAKTLASFLSLPISISDCTAMTQAGYVGDDVQSCVQQLYQVCGGDVERCEHGIIVLDEIDKLAKRDGAGRDVSGEGVQQSLLKMLEGTLVQISGTPGRAQTTAGLPGGGSAMPKESVTINTQNILFILMGAFVGLSDVVSARCNTSSDIGFGASARQTGSEEGKQKDSQDKLVTLANGETAKALDLITSEDLKKYGLIPELLGRAPTIVKLNHLTEEDLLRILIEPKNALVEQFRVKFKSFGTRIVFTKPALRIIAKTALSEGLGARGLHAVMEKICLNANYECPGTSTKFVLVDSAVLKDFSMTNNTRDVTLKYYSRGQNYIFIQDIAEEDAALADEIEKELAERPTVSKNSSNGTSSFGVREAARDVF
ncbi:ATP-dependent clpX-like chaperone [Yarrowia sp. C11]|nr:ATP-dependent clpX-like chaperone [Yarrowia sp. C11]KAG5363950.1 ATP-dependent clpX-like chaperone [Yarrowia sp. E02]